MKPPIFRDPMTSMTQADPDRTLFEAVASQTARRRVEGSVGSVGSALLRTSWCPTLATSMSTWRAWRKMLGAMFFWKNPSQQLDIT